MKTQDYIDEVLKYEERLSVENAEKFAMMFWRIRNANIDENEGAGFLHNCLDLILEGEQIGKTAEEMLGTENLEGFCKEFINETRKGYSLIKRIYLEISYIPIVLLMFFGVFQMGEEWLTHCIEYGFDWNVRIDTGMVITTVFVLIIAKLLLTRTDIFYQIFESKCKKEHNKGLLLMIVSMLLVTTITILTKIYMAVYMFSINYFFALGLLALICVVQNVWENK